jgi:hypothetical protein
MRSQRQQSSCATSSNLKKFSLSSRFGHFL